MPDIPGETGLTQLSIVWIIRRDLGLKWGFFRCLFAVIVSFSDIDISQGSVRTHLWCGGTYNNRVIANYPQRMPVKDFVYKIGQ